MIKPTIHLFSYHLDCAVVDVVVVVDVVAVVVVVVVVVDIQDTRLVTVEVTNLVGTLFGNNYFDAGKIEMMVDKFETKVVEMLVVVDVQSSWRDTGPLVVVMNQFDVHDVHQ